MKGHRKCQGLKEGTINYLRRLEKIYKEMTFEPNYEGRGKGCQSIEIKHAVTGKGSLKIFPK